MRFPHLDGRSAKLADALDLPPQLAEWLAVAALHSGCFLRSQLQFFGGYNEDNRMSVLRIIRRLNKKNLITETPKDSLGLLARITNKSVYRLLNASDIRHRRLASWPVMFRRLLSLDYVLDHPDLNWLPTESEKVACFDQLGIDHANLPRRVWDNATGHTVRLFANKHPIAVDPDAQRAVFVYADSEEKSPQGVVSWRKEHAALWADLYRLGFDLDIVHASFNSRLEESVSRVFASWKNLPQSSISSAELEAKLALVHQAIESNDDRELEEYGGFNGALRASVVLKEQLDQQTVAVAYAASYSTWFSERIAQAVSNPNPSGSHTASS